MGCHCGKESDETPAQGGAQPPVQANAGYKKPERRLNENPTYEDPADARKAAGIAAQERERQVKASRKVKPQTQRQIREQTARDNLRNRDMDENAAARAYN